MNPRVLVIAKEPTPGRVKTRLCPPCTPEQAAMVARAALEDTLKAVDATPAARRILVMDGQFQAPPGWEVIPQRGEGLAERLRAGFTDSATLVGPGSAVLVGMDTPQLTPSLVTNLAASLGRADAVLGPAEDGGWWGLALADPYAARALVGVPMSTSDTGRLTAAALRACGLRVVAGPSLRDVDTAADAWAVATSCPQGAFAAAVRAHVRPAPVPGAPG